MGDPKGFLKQKRRDVEYRPVCERIKDYNEVVVLRTGEISRLQASRCMDCGTPFCNWACPVGNYIPEWNDFMFKDRWETAYQLLQATNNFPEFTGRLCPAMCEYACVLGINDDPVTIRENELDIIERAFSSGLVRPVPPGKRTGKKIAVIGSGPSGLACADTLNKFGHNVVVFEKSDKVGGILRYGIPDFKLDKQIIERRLDILKKEGIEFITNVNVGGDVKFSRVKKEFDAITLTGGCSVPRDLKIKGRELKNVYFAMDYLIPSNMYVSGKSLPEDLNANNKNVVVIGGGDTGADCVGVANRQGAKCVGQIELLTQPSECRPETQPWPLYPMLLKTSTSHHEGVKREWGILTKEFIGEDVVRKISCIRVDFSMKDEKGCSVMREIPGTGFEIDADMVILALGFIHPENRHVVEETGLQLDDRGNIKTDSRHMTSIQGIFSAGDMRTGQSLIVKAIADGRACACHIDEYLFDRTYLSEGKIK
ncbi:MAG: glutamate synthase subunit beta [Candidatus Omnitrophica bacterium]|nr:glutamate synthase subunit beta [Candidatus Omnitrophota bacterium]